jgi:RNA polymerase sigma-70 factor, ECF subfamily
MPNPPPVSDEDLPLVRRAQAGDLDAFDELISRHQAMVTGLLHRFAPGRADLEDMVQDSFVRAWRALPGWQPLKPFVHWLKRIAVNVGLEFCRRRQCSPFGRLADPAEQALENLATASAAVETASALEEAQFLLAQAPPDDRALLTLLYLNEMPLSEIAQHFGWSLANAKIRAFRARQRLKSILKRNDYRDS